MTLILSHVLLRDRRVELANKYAEIEWIDKLGEWANFLEIHSEILRRYIMRENKRAGELASRVLASIGVALEALNRDKAVLLSSKSLGAGANFARMDSLFNSAVFLAARTNSPLISIDRHFPIGTWDLHLKLRFPMLAIYSGSEGPSTRYLAKRSNKIAVVPMPPGSSDVGFKKAASLIGELDAESVVVQIGFDLYYDDPYGEQFASADFYYELGATLSKFDRVYITIECLNTEEQARKALANLIASLKGERKQYVGIGRLEPRDVSEEVERIVAKARERLREFI